MSSGMRPLLLGAAGVAAGIAVVAVIGWNGRKLLWFDADSRLSNSSKSNGALVLKVKSGRDAGKSLKLCNKDGAELTMGRLDSNLLPFGDEEVSGKHAAAVYDARKRVWTLRDLGSLNGTRLNGREIGVPARTPGNAAILKHGDVITLGETTTIEVIIGRASFKRPSFVWAVRGQPSRKHIQRHEPSEDEVALSLSPNGTSSLFLFDGHCGRTAVAEAAEILPAEVAARLPRRVPSEGVSRELTEAFLASDEQLLTDHAGCTATAIIVWPQDVGNISKGCYVQVAHVGDSLAVVSGADDKARVMTSSHRLTEKFERDRLAACGLTLREGETRLYGLQISRVLGDRYLKQEDVGLIAEPSVSEVIEVGGNGDMDLLIVATDGLWDELDPQSAIDLAIDSISRHSMLKDETNVQAMVDAAADALISKARGAQGLIDDITVLVMKFDSSTNTEDVHHTIMNI